MEIKSELFLCNSERQVRKLSKVVKEIKTLVCEKWLRLLKQGTNDKGHHQTEKQAWNYLSATSEQYEPL